MYRFYLEDIARRAPHTLSEPEETLLARAGVISTTPSDIFNVLSNADFPYPSVTLSDGKTVTLDQAGYASLRALPNRADREKVMSTFFNALGGFSGTLGTMMNGEVQKVLFFANARKYQSGAEAQLNGANIPVTVYTRLIDGVNKSLPTFQRYLKLRKRMMGVDALHYYDLYAPLVGSVSLKYTPEEAQKLVLDAVAPLGDEYTSVVQRAFRDRWIDLFPTTGKASGAYSNGGAYDVHPYMLINYNGAYTDVSTVAHEMGHTMQSYFSNKTQPYPLAQYPIFVAEVASTFNEALLIDHMLEIVKDPDTRLALLGNYLENAKGTVFRQAQFAEFEWKMYELAQKGQPLTGEVLAKLYLDITRKYYGHDQGVCIVDDYIAHEWSYVPHFYRDFYVFQYATSFTASVALEEKVKIGRSRRAPALPGVHQRRRVEVSHRSAQGRRRGHDHDAAARRDDGQAQPRDGRDGEAARGEEVTGTATCYRPSPKPGPPGNRRPASRCSRWSRLPSGSARPPRSSPSSTACCCGRCRTRTASASCRCTA